MRIFKNVCLNPAFPWNFYLIQSLPLGGASPVSLCRHYPCFPLRESLLRCCQASAASRVARSAERGQSEILPLIPPSPWAGFACLITDCLLSFTFPVFAFDIGFPLGGSLRNKAVKKSFLFLFEKSPRKIFSNKGAVCKRTTAQKRTARQSIAPVYQALSPLFMVNGTGIYHKRPVHLFAQHHTHQLMRQSHIRKRKLKIRRPFHLRRQPARRAD